MPYADRSNNGPSCTGSLARGGPIAPARPDRASGPFTAFGKQGAPSTRLTAGACCSHRGIRDHARLSVCTDDCYARPVNLHSLGGDIRTKVAGQGLTAEPITDTHPR